MVKKRYVTQYGRKNYYRYGFRRYRNVSNTYFRARVEGVYTITFPVDQPGAPIFAENNQMNMVPHQTLLFLKIIYTASLQVQLGAPERVEVREEATLKEPIGLD